MLTSFLQYKVGERLPTFSGMPSAYTIVEMVEVDDATHAKCRFIAVDFKSKKTRGILTGKMRHKTIFGWIDEKGRWYN